MGKSCLSCGETLTGRADKKFCNEACKNEFHNQKLVDKPEIERIQRSMARKNRSILLKMEASGIGEIGKKELELCGFSFEGLTGLKFLGKKDLQLFCFEYMLMMNGETFKIGKIKS